MKYKIIETFDNGDVNVIKECDSYDEADNRFKELLREDGYKPDDYTQWTIELVSVDDDDEITETLVSQEIYMEGTIDRNRGTGSPLNYGYEAKWDASKKEMIYKFFFQGEKLTDEYPESELEKWFYH